jgi:general secretion pathway protein F
MVRAAEGTSDLPRALTRYIEYQQRIDVFRAKIVSASHDEVLQARPPGDCI